MTYHDPKSTADINHRFDFHPADTDDKRAAHADVRRACKQLAHKLDSEIPPGREKSVAIKSLEDVMFWANAAIARNV